MERILKIKAGVRYYEDSIVNGVEDISWDEQRKGTKPNIPCVREDTEAMSIDERWPWCPEIDVDTGIILNWEKGVVADIHYKVCDACEIEYYEDGVLVCNNDGYWYCPSFLCPKGEGYGDYIIMDITEEGQILGWSMKDVFEWKDMQTRRKD